ncbi:MAG TPA: methyltransferase domain-containing protein [Candidatus Limnocylindrales bacterium]|nr:methyltransferase domain-containing protein [Candidatus Limnocylindrales bacterium]
MASASDDDRRFTAELIAAWDRGAATYDAMPRHGILHDDEWRAWRRLLAAILGDAAHSRIAPRRILDVGTGTGVVALLAAELGHDVTGVDLSREMLARARSKAAEAGLPVDWRVADAAALPPDLVGFDVVIARHVLWTLPRPDRALTSWRDAARAGGLIVVIDGTNRRPPGPLGDVQRAVGRLADRLAAGNGGEVSVDHSYPAWVRARLPLADQRDTRPIAELLATAGLERVVVRPTRELDRVEGSHQPLVVRIADPWRRYVATARTPILTASQP